MEEVELGVCVFEGSGSRWRCKRSYIKDGRMAGISKE
jgi:hypothetical protein